MIYNHLTDRFCFGLDLRPQTSVLHMCSLFHAFMFAQLWTIYCEQAAAAPSLLNQNQTEFSSSAILTGLEFWSRVTPSILQLMAHNKVVSAHHLYFSTGDLFKLAKVGIWTWNVKYEERTLVSTFGLIPVLWGNCNYIRENHSFD